MATTMGMAVTREAIIAATAADMVTGATTEVTVEATTAGTTAATAAGMAMGATTEVTVAMVAVTTAVTVVGIVTRANSDRMVVENVLFSSRKRA